MSLFLSNYQWIDISIAGLWETNAPWEVFPHRTELTETKIARLSISIFQRPKFKKDRATEPIGSVRPNAHPYPLSPQPPSPRPHRR